MNISHFAKTINLPLCQYINQIPYQKQNKDKSRIWFLSGDPTVYGNNDFKMPPEGYQIMRKSIADTNNHGYTVSSGVPTAKEAVLKLYKPNVELSPNDVIIHHGVNQGLLSVVMAFTNPGDEILVPETGYPFFKDVGPSLGVNAIPYKLKADENFQIDLEHMKSLVTEKTQFIFIINPSNPMGTVYSRNHMQDILSFADQHELPIVSDEVYFRQTFPKVQYISFAQLTTDVPVIALSGVQKIFSTPGWCTSWAVIVDKHGYLASVRHNMEVLCTLFLHSNKFTMVALPELIEKLGIFTTEKLGLVEEVHDYLFEEMKKIECLKPIKAQGTIYLTTLVDTGMLKDIGNDRELVDKLLQEENINVMPLSIFGGTRDGFRILTCAEKPLYEDFLTRLKEFFERHK